MSEDKSKLQLIGEIIQADNKNLELIEELNEKEDEIERLNNIIKEVRELLKSDYFEDGSFTNQEKVFELLDKERDKSDKSIQ